MNKLLLIFFLSLFLNNVKADLGDPTIQSVCKVTLNNGKTIEGLITLGYGGYYGNWMNGFYLECWEQAKYKYEQKVFFTLGFKSFTKVDSSYDFVGVDYRNCRKIKFLQWVDGPSIYDAQKLVYDNHGAKDTVRIITHIERKYLALDSMTIYFEIPSDTYLSTFFDTIQKTKFQKVAVKDIIKFELLDHPAQKWIDMIATTNKRAQELYNGAESSGDFMEAAWYHEIQTNKEWLEQLQKGIVRNIER